MGVGGEGGRESCSAPTSLRSGLAAGQKNHDQPGYFDDISNVNLNHDFTTLPDFTGCVATRADDDDGLISYPLHQLLIPLPELASLSAELESGMETPSAEDLVVEKVRLVLFSQPCLLTRDVWAEPILLSCQAQLSSDQAELYLLQYLAQAENIARVLPVVRLPCALALRLTWLTSSCTRTIVRTTSSQSNLRSKPRSCPF